MAGADDESSENGLLWFNAQYHLLSSIESAVSVGPFVHSNTPRYWNFDNSAALIVQSTEATLYKTWVADDWKRIQLARASISTNDLVIE